jgi:perosamine synthetase
VPHAIAVSSGTAALHLAIRALGIGEGDEVIVPSFTFIAVANAVRYERATPVFADISPNTWNLSPASVDAAITSRTRAIIIVHTFGVPAELDALLSIAHRHHLAVIEDACEAIGGSYKDRRLGSFGDISVLGFYPNKQITTGEGGAILTADAGLARRMMALRNQGRHPSTDWLQHAELGFNYRLSEISCALGLAQLKRIDEILEMRAAVAQHYDRLLQDEDMIVRPPLAVSDGVISWFVYVVRIGESLARGSRDRIQKQLESQGIASGRYFAPIHLQPAYSDLEFCKGLSLPVTEAIAQGTLALPFFNRLSLVDLQEVTHALIQVVRHERLRRTQE